MFVLTFRTRTCLNVCMNTQKQVTEILETGIKQRDLAALVPCSPSLISALFLGERGKNISFAIGTRLAELHKRMVKNRRVKP